MKLVDEQLVLYWCSGSVEPLCSLSLAVLQRTNRRRPAEDDLCPVQAKSLRKDEETCFFRCHRKPLSGDEPPEDERTPVAGKGLMGNVSCLVGFTR